MVGSDTMIIAGMADMASKDPRRPSDAFSWRGAPKAFLTANGLQGAAKKLRRFFGTVLHPAELAEHRLPRLTAPSDQKGIRPGHRSAAMAVLPITPRTR